ncbi:MAG TPA: ATP-binding protein [Verrucomicrobiae bacterium]|nr:ATP-binding protein [Verrucomicrobiae bacterium]
MIFTFQDILVALAANLALLAVAVISYTQIKTFSQLKIVLHRLPSRFEPWLTGLALGLTAALAMTLPLAIAPGVIVDGSTVPIGLAAPVGGPIAGIIAALLAVVYRLSLGGAGDVAGTIGILAAAAAGLFVWSLLRYRRRRLGFAHLLLLGTLLVPCYMIGLWHLPTTELANSLIATALPPAAVALPLGALFLGTLLLQEQRRREFETRIAESERRYHSITDNMPGVVYQRELTADGEIRYPFLSSRLIDLFGVSAEEAMADSASLMKSIHPEDIEGMKRSVAESAQDLTIWAHEYRVLHTDGSTKWLHAKAVPHRRENGDVVWDGFVTDESDRKAAEMALSVANGLLTMTNERLAKMYDDAHQFVDDVAHEFRTPLTVIREFAAIMNEGLVGDLTDDQRHYLRVICARVDDLNGLVNDMLDLSRLEAGLISAARRECAVQEIVERVETVLTRRAAASRVEFKLEIDEGLPSLYCDAEKIGRVLVNLAINAFKYGGDKGGVTLWMRHMPATSQVMMGVTDNGPGIPQDKLEMIFERFKQAGRLRDTAKGFGLGLNIVRELVDLNLGDVAVQSSLGKGSTFSFTVPIFDHAGIVSLFADKLARERSDLFFVADIRIDVAAEMDEVIAADFDSILQQQVRGDELLIHVGPASWALLTPDKQEVEVRARARDLRERIGEIYGEIGDGSPALEVEPTGIWRLPGQTPALLARFGRRDDHENLRRRA